MMEENGLPKGWVETTLGEVSQFKYGKMPLKSKLNRGIYPTFSGYRYQYKYPEFNCKKGDVIVVARGVGGTGDVKIIKEQAYLTNLSILLILDEDVVSNEFLYFNYQHVNLRYLDSGSAQSQITINDLQTVTLTLPSLPEQKAIASILTSFDDKIELLQAQNETLETIAQTIFKEWFSKYQVGDELPEGWRVGKLGSVTKVVGGTTPSTKNPEYWGGSFHWTSPKDLSNSRDMFLLNTEKKITKEGLMKISSGLLPIGTLLLSSRAPIGYLSITTLELAINQGYIALIPGQYFSNSFMYLWLKLNMKTIENVANGSTFLEISKSSFRNIECVIPEKDVLKKLDKIIIPIFDKILSNLIQIQTLQQTRDTLLPKLMSGQLRVAEFQEQLSEVM